MSAWQYTLYSVVVIVSIPIIIAVIVEIISIIREKL